MFNEFNYKSGLFATSSKFRVLAATANAMVTSPGVMGPYLIGGIGIYSSSNSCSGCSSNTSSDVGLNGGGGFRFGLSGFSAFAEARYHYVNASNKYYFIPLTFGVTF